MAGTTNRELVLDAAVAALEKITKGNGKKSNVRTVERRFALDRANVGEEAMPYLGVWAQKSPLPPSYEVGGKLKLWERFGVIAHVSVLSNNNGELTECVSNLDDDIIAAIHADGVLQGGMAIQTLLVDRDFDESNVESVEHATFWHIWEYSYERGLGSTP